MNQRELKALSKVVAYVWDDEEKNLKEALAAGDESAATNHIFREVEVLDRYLLGQQPHVERPAGSRNP